MAASFFRIGGRLVVAVAVAVATAKVAYAVSNAGSPDPLPALRAAGNCAGWSQLQSLQIRGDHSGDGLHGAYVQLIDTHAGRFVRRIAAGSFRQADGYTGTTAWSRDFSGATHELNGSHARALARTGAWLDRHGWCQTNDATIYRRSATRSVDGRNFDVLSATPRAGVPVTLWIDSRSHLLTRTERRLNESREVTDYSDWRLVDDVPIAFERRVSYPEDEDFETYRTRDVKQGVMPAAAAFAAPGLPHDFKIIGGAHVARVPFTIEGDKPIVDVMLNGIGPFPFVLDTGSHFHLTPATAQRLGLTGVGRANSLGQGENVHITRFTRVHELRIGNAILTDQPAEIIAGSFARLERGPRPPKAGWLGLEFFERFATTFDPSMRRLTLAPLGKPRPTARGRRLPIAFDEDAPLIECSVAGRAGPCMIDTGNAGATIVEGSWAVRNKLVARLAAGIDVGEGVFVSRTTLQLGPLGALHELVEYSPPAQRGSEATTVEAAILSEGLLDRFELTVDYGRSAIWMWPQSQFAQRPFNRTGLEVDKQRDGDFIVWHVIVDSAAARASVHVGDRITAVDGVSAKQLAATDFNDSSRGPLGAVRFYAILRNNRKLNVTLILREIVR